MIRLYRVIYKQDSKRWKEENQYSSDNRIYPSLEIAKKHREVSGDLVVDWKTLEVIQSQDWLWDWEKADPNCYAQKEMRDGIS